MKSVSETGKVRYPVKAINILKAHGKSSMDTKLLNGYALNMGRAAQGMPRRWVGGWMGCEVQQAHSNRHIRP